MARGAVGPWEETEKWAPPIYFAVRNNCRLLLRAACAAALALAAPGAAIARDAARDAPRYVEAAAVAGLDHAYRDGPAPIASVRLGAADAYGLDAPDAGAFVVGGGVAALDCDADGLLDLVLAGGAAPAALYRNRTRPPSRPGAVAPIAFAKSRDAAAAFGLPQAEIAGVVGAYAFFWDADAEPDLLLLRFGRNRLLRGLGDCRFEDATDAAGLPETPDWTPAFAAYWPDGAELPVLALGSYVDRNRPLDRTGNCDSGYLLAPASTTAYGAPIPIEPAGCALSLLFVDWAGDGAVALRVSNDRQYADPRVGEQLFEIDGASGAPRPVLFTEDDGWRPTEIWGMGLAAADLDGDRRPEIVATSMADNRLEALVPSAAGAPAYENRGLELEALAHRPYVGPDVRPSTSWHAAFEDLNNDGALDLWIVKGNVSNMPNFAALDPDSILLGAPRGDALGVEPFVEVGFEAGVALSGRGRGGAAVDLNNDGLLDLVVVNYEGPTRLFQAIPTGAPARFLSVSLEQPGPNRAAIGAVLELETPDGRVQRRVLRVGGGHAGGSAAPAHFGLGAAATARLRVIWPDGEAEPWRDVAADARITLSRAP